MKWEQIVVLVWMLLNFTLGVFKTGKDRELSSGEAALTILLLVGCYVGFAAILHSGGFW